jgi:hypothetical protein
MCDYAVDNNRNITIVFKTINGYLSKIIYHNDGNGFFDLDKKGILNPMNMGYCNTNVHDDDNCESTFGSGTKDAWISLGDLITIYTKPSTKMARYRKVVFDIAEMIGCENSIDSYSPEFYSITKEDFDKGAKKYNFKKEGTIVEITNLINKIYIGDTLELRENFLKKVQLLLNKLYQKKLNNSKITIKCDDAFSELPIKNLDNIFVKNSEIKYNGILIVDNSTREIKMIIFEKRYKKDPKTNDEIIKYYEVKNDNHVISEKENNIKKHIYDSYYSYHISRPEIYTLHEFSIVCNAIYPTSESEMCSLFNYERKNSINIYRNNRYYGNMCFDNKNDGYGNFILSDFYYKSKKINTYIGVPWNKIINNVSHINNYLKNLLQFVTKCNRKKNELRCCKDDEASRVYKFINLEKTEEETAVKETEANYSCVADLPHMRSLRMHLITRTHLTLEEQVKRLLEEVTENYNVIVEGISRKNNIDEVMRFNEYLNKYRTITVYS